MTEIVTGDTFDLTVSLQETDGTASNVSAATSVKVALIRVDRASTLAGPYAASSIYTGAAWATGVIVLSIPGADTSGLTATSCEIEVQAIIGGKYRTWPRGLRGPAKITKGLIT